MNEPTSPAPKIIVDEDWKAQAQAEKEAAERLRAAAASKPVDSEPSPAAAAPPPTESPEPAPPTSAADDPPMPPASLPLLINTLATQAMASLGFLPDPIENKVVVRLNQAKHAIDMLGVLEEKTKGNLAAEESQMLAEALHQLRMAFVAARGRR